MADALNWSVSPVSICFETPKAPFISKLPPEGASYKPKWVINPHETVASGNAIALAFDLDPPEAAGQLAGFWIFGRKGPIQSRLRKTFFGRFI